MPICYYTCNLVPLDLVAKSGYTPVWLGNHLRSAAAASRRDILSVHPMTCPYVTKLVAAADDLFAAVATQQAADVARSDCLVVPAGCDAMRRLGDLLAATYPERAFVLSMPRSSGPGPEATLATGLRQLDQWLAGRLAGGAAAGSAAPSEAQPPSVDYPAQPRHGGVFLVTGPLSDASLLRLIDQLGAHVSGLESCTSPDRWRPLAPTFPGTGQTAPGGDEYYLALATHLLDVGMCPRRSTTERHDHLARRIDQMRPASIIYARQSFCDPGAYDSLLVAQLAKEHGLPFLEIEVDFPFDANGPLRTRVEAFLEAQLLDDDLLGDLLNDDDLFGADLPDGEV